MKHADSVKIKKDKLYKSFLLLNPETDRLNKNFQCTQCPKRFDKLSNVKDHVKTHLNSRPYSCHLCNLSFSQKGNRDRHIRRQSCLIDRNKVTRTANSEQSLSQEWTLNISLSYCSNWLWDHSTPFWHARCTTLSFAQLKYCANVYIKASKCNLIEPLLKLLNFILDSRVS